MFMDVEKAIAHRVNRRILLSIHPAIVSFANKFLNIVVFVPRIERAVSQIDKLSNTLTFDSQKASIDLNWKPNRVLPFIRKYL